MTTSATSAAAPAHGPTLRPSAAQSRGGFGAGGSRAAHGFAALSPSGGVHAGRTGFEGVGFGGGGNDDDDGPDAAGPDDDACDEPIAGFDGALTARFRPARAAAISSVAGGAEGTRGAAAAGGVEGARGGGAAAGAGAGAGAGAAAAGVGNHGEPAPAGAGVDGNHGEPLAGAAAAPAPASHGDPAAGAAPPATGVNSPSYAAGAGAAPGLLVDGRPPPGSVAVRGGAPGSPVRTTAKPPFAERRGTGVSLTLPA